MTSDAKSSDHAFAVYLRRPSYRARPAVTGDLRYKSGVMIEVNVTDPPAPIWTGGFHVPLDRIEEVIAILEAARDAAVSSVDPT